MTVAPKSIQASGDGFSFKSINGKDYYVYHNVDHKVKGVEFISKKNSTVCLTIDTPNAITSVTNGKCKSEKDDINFLIAQENKVKGKCKASYNPDTSKSCKAWIKTYDKLEAKGWCWGREEQAEFEKEWQKCK